MTDEPPNTAVGIGLFDWGEEEMASYLMLSKVRGEDFTLGEYAERQNQTEIR